MKSEYQDTRLHLIATGRTMMLAKGFSAVGLAEILASAKVPKGSFYHYFKSKEQFGTELLLSYFDDYLTQLDQQLTQAEGDGQQRLLGYWRQWQESHSSGQCDSSCLVVKLSAEVADLSDAMRQALAMGTGRIVARLAEAVATARAEGTLASGSQSPTLVAEGLYALWLGASLLTKVRREPSALQAAMTLTEEQLMRP